MGATAIPEQTAYRHVVRGQGIRGGSAVVEGTRIGVHDIVGLLQNGETVDSLLLACFPDLTKSQVYSCLAYYEDHRGEIDLLIARQMPAELEQALTDVRAGYEHLRFLR